MTSQRGSHKALLGRKLGMTQVWDENGFFVPVTLVDVSANVVTAVKSEETDGYKAIQIGYGQIDPTKVTKPLAGHFAKAGVTPRRHLVEVRTEDAAEYEPGQELSIDAFAEGSEVDVTGTTKARASRARSSAGASSPTAVPTVLTRTNVAPAPSAHAPLRAVSSRASAWPAAWVT